MTGPGLAAMTSGLRVMVYTAQPGTPDAERLDFLSVVGTQSLTEQEPGSV
ncbi:hypothetical protein [Streptomyces sp. NPDC048462]